MGEIPVFRSEVEAGLEEQIRSSGTIAFSSAILPSPAHGPETVRVPHHTQADADDDLVLYRLRTLLATTGWNLNDDVLDRQEVWAARHSPEDTPFNLGHECDRIIGHIVGSYVIDDEDHVVADDCKENELPSRFHVVTPAVIYKLWPKKPDVQEKMDAILQEIAEGKWYVSMECYFRGFDYALQKGNENLVVARSDQTSFLTAHLRAYKGSGTYNGYRVGRLLRNITFSGKGLVEKPANPESIIFTNASIFVPSLVSGEDFTKQTVELGYSTAQDKIDEQTAEITVAIEIETLQKSLETANAEIASLKEQLQAAKASADKHAADLAEKDKAFQATLAELENAKKAAADLKVEHDKVAASFAQLKTEKTRSDRLAKLKSALQVDESSAEAVAAAVSLNDSLMSLADDQFDAYVVAQAKLSPVPKVTPAPTPPKQTPAPTPPSQVKANLEDVVTTPEPALAVATEQEGVKTLRTSIAGLFGHEQK